MNRFIIWFRNHQIYSYGVFKYHITLFWTFANPSSLSQTILTLWFNPPPFSCVRIHIATELASHFTVFCRIFSKYQYKKTYIEHENLSHTRVWPFPLSHTFLTPVQGLTRPLPSRVPGPENFALPPPPAPPLSQVLHLRHPPLSGEWYDNFKKW